MGCTGFYDKEENGVKYFDGSGTALMQWEEGFPTYFYAKYKSIEEFNTITYGSNDVRLDFHYSFGNDLNALLKTAEYKNALRANLDMRVQIGFSFYGTETRTDNHPWTIYFKTNMKYEEGNIGSTGLVNKYQGKVIYPKGSFSRFSHEGYFTCRDVNSNGAYAFLTRGATTGYGTITDWSVSIKFIS